VSLEKYTISMLGTEGADSLDVKVIYSVCSAMVPRSAADGGNGKW